MNFTELPYCASLKMPFEDVHWQNLTNMIFDYLELLASEALMLVTLLFTTHLSRDICIFIVDGKKRDYIFQLLNQALAI